MGIAFEDKLKLGQRIKKQRTEDGQSLRSLAAKCKMNYATLNDIENGNGFPTEKVFLSIMANLNFPSKEDLYDFYAGLKDTAPPDVVEFLSKNKEAVIMVRQAMKNKRGNK